MEDLSHPLVVAALITGACSLLRSLLHFLLWLRQGELLKVLQSLRNRLEVDR